MDPGWAPDGSQMDPRWAPDEAPMEPDGHRMDPVWTPWIVGKQRIVEKQDDYPPGGFSQILNPRRIFDSDC